MSKTTLWAKLLLIGAFLLSEACGPRPIPPSLLAKHESVINMIRHGSPPLGWLALHRGNVSVWPGNTELGIKEALALSTKLIEVDIRRNSDSQLFLFHDRRLNDKNFFGPPNWLGRTAESLNNQELKQLCFPPDKRACAIGFQKALQLISGTSSAYLLDLKNVSPDMIRQIVDQAQSSNQLGQIIMQIPKVTLLDSVRVSYPNAAILARCFNPEEVLGALNFNPEIVQIDEEWMNKNLIDRIHDHRTKVLVKTLDGDDSATHHLKLFQAGVDIVLTDKIRDR
jgi:glycerophosphoryl diester phosphodiesterase